MAGEKPSMSAGPEGMKAKMSPEALAKQAADNLRMLTEQGIPAQRDALVVEIASGVHDLHLPPEERSAFVTQTLDAIAQQVDAGNNALKGLIGEWDSTKVLDEVNKIVPEDTNKTA